MALHKTKRATSADVARLAGVSQTTVSFVINNVASANISPETRTRVLEAIEQLNYVPHEAARTLGRKASKILGIAIPDPFNAHYQQTVAGTTDYARRHGYNTFVTGTNYDVENERLALQWLRQQRYDALILMAGTDQLELDRRLVVAEGFPIIGIGIVDVNLDCVDTEPETGERAVLEHLAGLGHRSIGYIYGTANQRLFNKRLETCLRIQQEMGLPIDERFIRRCGTTMQDGYDATRVFVQDTPAAELPTALIVVNDLLAQGTLAALHHCGFTVPNEVSVCSFDNVESSAFTIPALTTVESHAVRRGEEAARLALARLAQPQSPPMSITVPTKLIIRDSTGPVRLMPIDAAASAPTDR
jgi:DNA-binding LacI/PurR family transcriptional regulator